MKENLRWLLRIFTIALVGVSIWTAYANVFSDDLDVRARAGELARITAGCAPSTQPKDATDAASKCKVTSMRGSRGMIEEEIEYDIDGPKGGHITVVCRRANIVFGDYACTASKR